MSKKTEAKFVSIADIKEELGCSTDHATKILLFELPHLDIRAPGSLRPRWRASRKDFESWKAGRQHRPGREALEAFTRQYMR